MSDKNVSPIFKSYIKMNKYVCNKHDCLFSSIYGTQKLFYFLKHINEKVASEFRTNKKIDFNRINWILSFSYVGTVIIWVLFYLSVLKRTKHLPVENV